MLFKKITLHNIRSYTDAEIVFTEGKTLIAGDIGAGKSTIFVAIEFALFGLLKGEISGSLLLRHGANEGFVELAFEVNNKDIIIRRTLKHSLKGIEQDAGFIVKQDLKEEAMPTELKAQILGLLGYPEDLMAKSKSLLFRYTVYTPQEEMKRILLGDAEERLNIIRRIFGMDKYKRVLEQSEIYTRHVREQMRELQGKTHDIEQKKSQQVQLEKEHEIIKQDVQRVEKLVAEMKAKVDACRAQLIEHEKTRARITELRKEYAVISASLSQLMREQQQLQGDALRLQESITMLSSEITTKHFENSVGIKETAVKKQSELISHDKERVSFASKISAAATVQKISQGIIEKMRSLDTCPLCLQKVTDNHKESILKNEQAKVSLAQQEFQEMQMLQKKCEESMKSIRADLDTLREQELREEHQKAKEREHHDKVQQLERVKARIISADAEIKEKSERKLKGDEELKAYIAYEENFQKTKSALDTLLCEERQADVLLARAREKKLFIEERIKSVAQEIKEKEALVSDAQTLKQRHDWMRELFCPLVGQIEKQVLARVYCQFNELFQQWFSLLVNDDMFSAQLDDSFAPVLHQNGCDTFAENLSGGEKTACALAYRLALNKVINDVLTLVQTKDVLLLDEPTDGFSDEQLDCVRDVLNHLGLKQIILVSHERKVEGFVDNIIHITKEGHISSVQGK